MSIYKYPKWMRLYKKLDIGESCFHSGFLYGFIMFFIISTIFRNNIYSNLALLFGYLLFDQIIYRVWINKHKGAVHKKC